MISVWTSHPFTDGPTRIRVRAAGDLMKNVGPHMVVSIDGTTIGDAYATTTFTDYDFDFTATAGTHVVKVTYDNDDCDVVCTAGRDRNLFLQTVSVICLSNDAGADGGDAAASDGGDGGSSGGGDASAGTDSGSGGGDGGGGGEECTPASCTTTNLCLVAQCTGGTCKTTPAAAGTPCSSNACNGIALCDGAGVCVPAAPPAIDDGNPCTVDACDPVLGVTHTPVPAGTSCSDGDACNGVETCDGVGVCVPGAAPSCSSADPCNAAGCDPFVGCAARLCSSLPSRCFCLRRMQSRRRAQCFDTLVLTKGVHRPFSLPAVLWGWGRQERCTASPSTVSPVDVLQQRV